MNAASSQRAGYGIAAFQTVCDLNGNEFYFPILKKMPQVEVRGANAKRNVQEYLGKSITSLKEEYYGRIIEREQEMAKHDEFLAEGVEIRKTHFVKDSILTKTEPRKFFDLIGDSKGHREVLSFLSSWKKANLAKQRKKILLVHGPTGIGKFTTIKCAAAAVNMRIELISVMQVNANDLGKQIIDTCRSKSIASTGAKIVVLKEVDALNANDSGGNALINALKKVLRVKSSPPIIMLCLDFYSPVIRRMQRDANLRFNTEVIQMKAPMSSEITKRLKNFLEDEGLDEYISDDVISSISSNNKGDLRSALHTLEWQMLITPDMNTLGILNANNGGAGSTKDTTDNIFTQCRKIFNRKNKPLKLLAEASDPQFAEKICWENSFSMRYTDPMMETTWDLADTLSDSDTLGSFGSNTHRLYISSLAFSTLSPLSVPPMRFPKHSFRYDKERYQCEAVKSSLKEAVGSSSHVANASNLKRDFFFGSLPLIFSSMNIGVKKGSFEMLSKADEEKVQRLQEVLMSFGMTYTWRKESGNYAIYPEIDRLVSLPGFEALSQEKIMSNGMKQAIAAEIRRSRADGKSMIRDLGSFKRERKNENTGYAKKGAMVKKRKLTSLEMYLNVKPPSSQSQIQHGLSNGKMMQPGKKITADPSYDFSQTQDMDNSGRKNLKIRYKFFEGFSGSVKRFVTIGEFK